MANSFFIMGCGKMGSALLAGWLSGTLADDTDFIIIDPFFDPSSPALAHSSVHHFTSLDKAIIAGHNKADMMLLSVKPQMMAEALADISKLAISDTLFLSIAAGTTLRQLADMIGAPKLPAIIRTMPNTPAAIGKGMTALIGNDATSEAQLALAEELMSVCGLVVRLQAEAELDAVTALSGSGPAYIFAMAEAMTQAGIRLGLSPEMASLLAQQTIYGAGALMAESDETPATLRINVTSKGGTTAAALAHIMADDGLAELMMRAMQAAYDRSQSLGQ